MLFTYQYISHEIEKLQEYLDFLFYEVWLKAEGPFDHTKLAGKPELEKIYIDFGNSDLKGGDFFNESIETIYAAFLPLTDSERQDLRTAYNANNDVASLCSDKTTLPMSYADLEAKHPNLATAVKEFYSKLYGSGSPFDLKAFGQLNKKLLPAHYKAFMQKNSKRKCPFCGIIRLDSNHDHTREAYDHYLPKALYPFNAINFRNLAPMCHKCNSGNKSTKDPIDHANVRQYAFYPYQSAYPALEIELTFDVKKVTNLTPADIQLNIKVSKHQEQVDSWLRVFNIEHRYKTLLCDEEDAAKEWYTDVHEDFINAKNLGGIQSAEEYYKKVLRATQRHRYSAEKLLKEAFLKECKKQGLFKSRLVSRKPTQAS